MVRPPKKNKITEQEFKDLLDLAKEFDNRQEFISAYPEAYKVARCYRIVTPIFKHMKRISPPRVWSLEKLQKEAKKYNHRGDFGKGSPKAYDMAHKRGLLDQICEHMTFKIKKTWDEEYRQYLIKEIDKCKTYNEFRLKFPDTLKTMRQNKLWLDILIPLEKYKRAFTSVGECTLKNFLERLFKVKFTKSYLKGLENKQGYQLELDGYNKKLGLAFEHNGDHHKLERVKINDRTKKRFCSTNNIKLLVTRDLSSFYGKEVDMVKYIKTSLEKIGIKVPEKIKKIKVKWIFPDNGTLKYTYESLIEEAKKYKTLKEFREQSPKHYETACDRKMMPEIRKFLVVQKTSKSDDELISIAKKYKTLVDFSKGNYTDYRTLCTRSPEVYARATAHLIRITKPSPEREKALAKYLNDQ